MRAAPLFALLLPCACAAPAASDPVRAHAQLGERYARAQAVELTGTLITPGRKTRLTFLAAAPAAGSLEISTVDDFLGELQTETQRWIGDGQAIYLVDDARQECALTAGSWRQLEVLSQLDFLAPAWTLGSAPAAERVEWGAPERPGQVALRVLRADGTLSREYQLAGGRVVAAKGWTEEGDWTFTTEDSKVLRAASAADYLAPLPQNYAVLGSPFDEFNHLRGLLQPGEQAPDIGLIELDGRERTLSEFGGRPLLIAFWFYY